MFDFEGDDDFDTLSVLRDYEGPGDFSGQVQPGRFDALLGGPGAGGYLDAPAASQEASQTDAARAERDRIAADEAARVQAENEARWAEEDAAAARVQVGGTVVIGPDGTATVTGGDQFTPEEAARRSAEATAAAREFERQRKALQERAQRGAEAFEQGRGNTLGGQSGGVVHAGTSGQGAQDVVNRIASGELRNASSLGRGINEFVESSGLGSILSGLSHGLGGLVSGLPGALASLFLGQQASGLSGLLANVLGAADSSATNLELARRLAAQVLGVTVPQLDELQRYVTEQRAQWDATAEHRALMNQEQFRNDLLSRMWSVEEQLRRLQGSVDMIGPARW